ncbi:hypothetical protein, partial [Actinomadura geliboluensis]
QDARAQEAVDAPDHRSEQVVGVDVRRYRVADPSPARYCGARDRDAEFRVRDWYCVPRGGDIGVDTKISMTAVCASQYRPDAEARLRGDAADPGDWECYVLR